MCTYAPVACRILQPWVGAELSIEVHLRWPYAILKSAEPVVFLKSRIFKHALGVNFQGHGISVSGFLWSNVIDGIAAV